MLPWFGSSSIPSSNSRATQAHGSRRLLLCSSAVRSFSFFLRFSLGATLNSIQVARYLMPRGYIGCIGKDKFGEEMKKRCSLDGVKVSLSLIILSLRIPFLKLTFYSFNNQVHYYEIPHLWELVLFVWLVVKGRTIKLSLSFYSSYYRNQ
ncbi:hypothetical protein ACSQ67_001256 [Phaseolus vulgaris]